MNSSLLFSSIDNNPPSYNSIVSTPMRPPQNEIITQDNPNPNPNHNFLDKYICNKNGCLIISIICIIITIIIIIVS
jgi:hypothetical protein